MPLEKIDRSDLQLGTYRGDKSVLPACLVKGGAAKPPGSGPGPVDHRLPPRSSGRLVDCLEKFRRRWVALAHLGTERPVQHLLQSLAHILTPTPGGGKLVCGLFGEYLLDGQAGERGGSEQC